MLTEITYRKSQDIAPRPPDDAAALAAGSLESNTRGAGGGTKTGGSALGRGSAGGLRNTARAAHDAPAPVPVWVGVLRRGTPDACTGVIEAGRPPAAFGPTAALPWA